jgi:hypothetical protein
MIRRCRFERYMPAGKLKRNPGDLSRVNERKF